MFLVLLSFGGILCAFFLVPRGISLLDTPINVDRFEIDGTNQSFVMAVSFVVPFKNPNYVSVDVTGQVNMTYYGRTAATKDINMTLSRLDTTEARPSLTLSRSSRRVIDG